MIDLARRWLSTSPDASALQSQTWLKAMVRSDLTSIGAGAVTSGPTLAQGSKHRAVFYEPM